MSAPAIPAPARREKRRAAGVLVSVIVPTRNGGQGLERLVAALAMQSLPRDQFEVIVGDDGSADGSAENLETDDGWLTVTAGPPINSYAARNRGVAISSASILAFCDADCRPEPGWLQAGIRALDEADIVGGLVLMDVPEDPSLWTLLDGDMFLDQERIVRAGRAVTANLFVRREFFDRVGGFDPTLPRGDDQEFVARCVAAGARLAFDAEARVWHATRTQATSLLRKVWETNWCHAVREGRAGRQPSRVSFRSWVPLVQPFRGRRRAGRPLTIDRRRLEMNGRSLRRSDMIRALPLLYLVIPYVANAAQLSGWWYGRRLR